VTLSDTFDLLDIAPGDIAPSEDDRVDPIAIGHERAREGTTDDDLVPEPTLAVTPFFIEFNEPPVLDPERSGLIWELQQATDRTIGRLAPLVALLLHMLPAITIVLLPLLMVEPPPPIPVQLVFEQPAPAPPPPPPPAPEPKPQPKPQQQPKMEVGRLASVDMGAVKPSTSLGRTADPVQQPSAGQQQPNPTDTETASATPPPPVPMPKPSPPKERSTAFQLPKPSGANVPHREETPHEAPHSSRYAGPAATRDEYLAYLVSLTRQHIGLLPMSFIGDRRGETVLSLVIHDNGAIGPMTILQSSGYPDIDRRVQEMVAAVGRAPPLPQWFQGDAMELEFRIKFPEALEHPE
jgi:TonB family protein